MPVTLARYSDPMRGAAAAARWPGLGAELIAPRHRQVARSGAAPRAL